MINVNSKIVFYSHDAHLYGATRSMIDLIRAIECFGVQSFVILPTDGPATSKLRECNINYKILGNSWWVHKGREKKSIRAFIREIYYILKRSMKNITMIKSHVDYVKEIKPDYIYVNTSVAPMGIYVSKLLKIKCIFHIRELQKEYFNYDKDLGNWIFSRSLRSIYKVVVNSKFLWNYISQNYGVESIVIYNGICGCEGYDERLRKGNNVYGLNENFVFGIIGPISVGKGQHIALRAFEIVSKAHSNVMLYIIGGGSRKSLEDMKEYKETWNKMIFTGFVDDIEKYYLTLNVLLMCSTNETFGRVTVEAMSYGIPVIGNNRGGTREIITNGVTGYTYDNDHIDLAKKMIYCVENKEQSIIYSKSKQNCIKHSFQNSKKQQII